MKKFIYYIITLACICSVSSCSLDEEVYTEADKTTYMKNASEAQYVLLGVYRDMVQANLYGYNLSCLLPIPSDLAKCEGSTTNGFRQVPANAYTPAQADIQNTWQSLYGAVYDANSFIEMLQLRINEFPEKDRSLATIYMAEARGLRALYYFELVRWFGNIALITNTQQSYQHPSTYTQAKPEDVYKFIEEDLLYAVDNLPYAKDDASRSDNRFRLSKGAAMGLLAKVYATWAGQPVNDESKWEKAAQIAGELINSGKHQLLSDYEQLWKNTCNGVWDANESLIEVSFYAPAITGSSLLDPCGRIGKWNGVALSGKRSNKGNWKVSCTFLRDWYKRQEDKRWALSFADYIYAEDKETGKDGIKTPVNLNFTFEQAITSDEELSNSGMKDNDIKKLREARYKDFDNKCCPAKWDTEKYVEANNALLSTDYSNINWYILRYADVLLLYAEALNEWKQGPTTEAYTALNMVRRRGFRKDVQTPNANVDLSGLDYKTFQQAVRDERAYELAYEGHRRQDLVRWGIYYETIQNTYYDMLDWCGQTPHYICFEFTQKGKHELLPIPQRDLDLMTSFKQNPGWGK